MRRYIEDIKKYHEFIKYSIKTELKVYLSGTYLAYLWWLLDPLMYMLVYVIVVQFIFNRGQPNFPVFVFSALLSWKWTSGSIMQSADSIRQKGNIIKQVYVPKITLPLIKNTVNSIYYLFGVIVLLLIIPLFHVGWTWHIIEFPIIFIVQYAFLLGVGTILAHLGVYFSDVKNILKFTIRFWFYMSPALYSIDDIPERVRFIWYLNPMTIFYQSYRNVFLYGQSPKYFGLFLWLVISIMLIGIGNKMLYKYDKNYTKVI